MRHRWSWPLFLWACWPEPGARALDPDRSLEQYALEVWRLQEGLPQDAVNDIAQSGDGQLWVATDEGVARFDGLEFRGLGRDELDVRTIHALAADADGALWIGTGGAGLWRWANRELRPFDRRDGLASISLAALERNAGRELWMANMRGQLVRFAGGRFSEHELPQRSQSHALLRDRRGRLWIGADAGLFELRDGRLAPVTAVPAGRAVRALVEDAGGGLWIGTDQGLAVLRDGGASQPVPDLPGVQVLALAADGDGNVWAGTTTGLARVHDGRVTRARGANVLSAAVSALFVDREGSLWIGTRGSGLARLRSGAFTTIGAAEGLGTRAAGALLVGRDGTLWVGSESGVDRYVPAAASLTRLATTPPGFAVMALARDRGGRLWAGGPMGHLSWTPDDGGAPRWTEVHDPRLACCRVSALEAAADGGLWIGTGSGALLRHDGAAVTEVAPGTGPDGHGNRVTALVEDAGGGVWIASQKTFRRWHRGALTRYGAEQGVPGQGVRDLHVDAGGRLWLATPRGVCRFADDRLRCFGAREGLPSALIDSLTGDSDGRLWIASRRGVFPLDRAALAALDRGEALPTEPALLGAADGLRNTLLDAFSHPVTARTPDGRVWFATADGLAVVDPRRLQRNPVAPPAAIDQVLVDGKAVSGDEAPRLPAGSHDLEIHYSGISLSSPQRVTFRYRLDGHERGWTEARRRRVASYSNLPPGQYRFQVMAANSDGVSGAAGASYAFTVLPHVYQRPPFFVGAALLLALAAYSVHAWRLRRLAREAALVMAERTRVARELHDTLLQNLLGVSFQLETALSGKVPAPEVIRNAVAQLQRAATEARRSILELRDGDPGAPGLERALRASLERLTAGTPVEGHVSVSGRSSPMQAPIERELLRIAEEAMANAVRHAGARTLFVELNHGGSGVTVRVRDDGKGLGGADAGAGAQPGHFGLPGMRERAAAIGARLEVRSGPGQGTEVEVDWRSGS